MNPELSNLIYINF